MKRLFVIALVLAMVLAGCSAAESPRLLATMPAKGCMVGSTLYTTLSACGNAVQAGGTMYISGTWTETLYVAKNSITIEGIPATLSGGLGIRCSGKSGVTIRNIEVTGSTAGNYGAAVFLDGCSNSVLDNLKVHDNVTATVSGIGLNNAVNNKILHSDVFRNAFVGIVIGGNSQGNEVAFNMIHDHTMTAGDSDGLSMNSPATGNTIHDNQFFGNSDDGLDTWTSKGNTITNNVAYSNGGTGDGNGFKLGGGANGGSNVAVSNVAYGNLACGFTSNGSGNYYEKNSAYLNKMCGFDDGWRVSNSTPSQFLSNVAYGNPKNFQIADMRFVSAFSGNSELSALTPLPVTVTASTTATKTQPPVTVTPTFTLVPGTPTSTPACDPKYLPEICIYRLR